MANACIQDELSAVASAAQTGSAASQLPQSSPVAATPQSQTTVHADMGSSTPMPMPVHSHSPKTSNQHPKCAMMMAAYRRIMQTTLADLASKTAVQPELR